MNTVAGAFFTPPGLARSFCIEVGGRRIIDCAPASAPCRSSTWRSAVGPGPDITCVEINPDYIAVGRKLLPEAMWIQASVFDLPPLGRFDFAISNPPFGNIQRGGKGRASVPWQAVRIPRDRYRVGPRGLWGIHYPSDVGAFRIQRSPRLSRGEAGGGTSPSRLRPGSSLAPTAGSTAPPARADWHGVAPKVEIVTADFVEARARRAGLISAQADLFSMPRAAE